MRCGWHSSRWLCRKLEQGLIGPKRERFVADDAQLKLAELMKMVVPGAGTAPAAPPTQVPAHERAKPTGRQRPAEPLLNFMWVD